MSRRGKKRAVLAVMMLAGGVLILHGRPVRFEPVLVTDAGRFARIEPDYVDVTIPANIAPMNFLVAEDGDAFVVRVASPSADFELHSRDGWIEMPAGKWSAVMKAGAGARIGFKVLVRREGRWWMYEEFEMDIGEPIDRYVTFRKIRPVYSESGQMGIFQRDLSGFGERAIIEKFEACVNCHTFVGHSSQRWLFGARGLNDNFTMLFDEGQAQKIKAQFGYSSWHPSGEVCAYSVNKVRQFFHSARAEVRDVVDLDSVILCYDHENRRVIKPEVLADVNELETFPCFSPDGKYLYYCVADILWTDRETLPPKDYEKVRYDLVRSAFDLESRSFSEPEMVLSSESAEGRDMSILMPRISPDGRWLVFCMCEYSCWPAYQASSDLYILDLQEFENGDVQMRPLAELNSGQSESWHCFSSNSRWVAFSSKRENGLFTRFYLAHMDGDGVACKPFLPPQQRSDYYEDCLWTLGVAELTAERIDFSEAQILRAMAGDDYEAVDIPVTMATPVPGGYRAGQ